MYARPRATIAATTSQECNALAFRIAGKAHDVTGARIAWVEYRVRKTVAQAGEGHRGKQRLVGHNERNDAIHAPPRPSVTNQQQHTQHAVAPCQHAGDQRRSVKRSLKSCRLLSIFGCCWNAGEFECIGNPCRECLAIEEIVLGPIGQRVQLMHQERGFWWIVACPFCIGTIHQPDIPGIKPLALLVFELQATGQGTPNSPAGSQK